jgi:hypothetical protein
VVVLVEGESDRVVLETVASRRGLDLQGAGVTIVAMGGATNIRSHLDRFESLEVGPKVAGLYDVGEERFFRRALNGSSPPAESSLEPFGFFVCDRDLEDEMIRALGVPAVLDVVNAEREASAFRSLQKQPAHREGTVEDQLRRFIGTKSGRKARYGRLLADALPLDRVPRPLDRLLTHVVRISA